MSIVALIALGWAWVLANITAVALVRAWLFWRRQPASDETGELPRTLLVRPCSGTEARLVDNLTSVLRARRSFDLEVCLSVEDATDAALPDLHRASELINAAGVPCRVALNPAAAPNPKASQLAAIVDQLDHSEGGLAATPLLINADSDVDLEQVDLDRLLSPLLEQRVAACWAPFVESATPQSIGDRSSAALLRGSLHGFVLLAGLDRRGLVGKLFACRIAAVQQTGGFGGLAEQLGEDMELARRLRSAGYQTMARPCLARSTASGRSFGDAVSRYARWLSVIRAQRPWLLPSYPTLFLGTWPLAIASLLLCSQSPLVAAGTATLALGSRWATALLGRRLTGAQNSAGEAFVDALLADALLTLAWLRACATRRVLWRNRPYVISRGGLLQRQQAPPPS